MRHWLLWKPIATEEDSSGRQWPPESGVSLRWRHTVFLTDGDVYDTHRLTPAADARRSLKSRLEQSEVKTTFTRHATRSARLYHCLNSTRSYSLNGIVNLDEDLLLRVVMRSRSSRSHLVRVSTRNRWKSNCQTVLISLSGLQHRKVQTLQVSVPPTQIMLCTVFKSRLRNPRSSCTVHYASNMYSSTRHVSSWSGNALRHNSLDIKPVHTAQMRSKVQSQCIEFLANVLFLFQ